MARGFEFNEHLGAEELPKMLEEFRRRGDPSLDLGDIHRHLTVCSACREQFEELATLDRQLTERPLMTLPPNEFAPRSGDCPDATIWREIAGGLTPSDQTLPLVEHASSCDHCGPLLRRAIVEFTALGGELSEAEYKQISELESARAPWQQKLAQRITSTTHANPDRHSDSWWDKFRTGMSVPRLALAGSLAAVIVAGSLAMLYTYDYRSQPAEASRLLASAYTEKRTVELRIAGAAYAPLRVSRGAEASFTSRPAPLLKAEALIAVQIASHPGDPAWLQAQAQADVLEGKYDAAVESLRRALELEPNSPAYRIDLATAYFQRAQASNRKQDLGAAYENLSKALQLRPDDPVALFNRALVAEHQFLYHQALDDWNRYLQIDPHSQWSSEAREAAKRISTTLKNHDTSEAVPLLSPAQIAAVEKSDPVETGQRVIDPRIEEYLHDAVRTWLPQAFPTAGTKHADLVANPVANSRVKPAVNNDASKAIFFLADLTSRRHSDRWLADLLRSSADEHFPQAVNALARAAQANDAGDYDVARQQAVLAGQLFAKSGNQAGALRAQFERIFADQLTRHSEDCRRESIASEKQSRLYPYPWLQIQLQLEQSVCSDLMVDFGDYEKIAERAQKGALQAGYGLLYLRTVVFVGESKFNTGNAAEAWKLANAGLERYWSSNVPPLRGYGLYALLASMVEFSRQPNLRLALWREGVDMIDADEDLRMRGGAHGIMAEAANEAHRPDVAEAQFRESNRLYSLAPQTEAIRSLLLETDVRAIQVDLREGSSQNALARLTAMQEQVQGLSNDTLAQLFYSTLGEAQLRSHHAAEAEQAYRAALGLAEQNLASLDSEAKRARWSKDAAPVYLGLAEAELRQGREQESLDVFEWYLAAPERVGGGAHHSSPDLVSQDPMLQDRARPLSPTISSRLPVLSDQTTLALAALPDGVAVWVYDDRGVSSKWIPISSQQLEELAVDFSAQCSDPNSDLSALRRNSRHLYDALIAPIEEHLVPGRPLIIEAEGWLARVPFEALLDAKGHYLIERASLIHSLGQDSQSRLHSSTAISADMPMLAVGSSASSAGDELGSLPDVSAEAQAVAGDFHSAQLLNGDTATLSAIQSDLPAAAVFHFAGHALSAPEKTGLLLQSEDGNANTPRLMDAAAVRHLDTARLQLAVLSACGTASGSDAGGFDNIADAFVRNGVPHVVASRWPVDSAGTQAFIQDFYRNALSGRPVSEAIRLTSRKMMANPSTSHPYYWSEFAAYGRP